MSLQVVVVGGGAAGVFAAIECAIANPRARVVILESARQPLAKVRISGGGRCNVTHACFEPGLLVQNYPRGGKALRGAFSRFQARDTVAWFAARGVSLKTEADGRMFPTTDSSATIVECLLQEADESGVKLHLGESVTAVRRHDDRFWLDCKSGKSGRELGCDRLLLATGSSPAGYRLATSLGHAIAAPVPSLFTFTIADPLLAELAGLSVQASLQLAVGGQRLKQQGPVLITHWGLSGPAVLRLSAWGARLLHDNHYRAELRVNWLPGLSGDRVLQHFAEARTQFPKRSLGNGCPFDLPRRLWQYLLQRAGLEENLRWAEFPKQGQQSLSRELLEGSFAIAGKGAFKEEFVTCGGVSLEEVNFKTMESRCCPSLYFAGEVLDIDGITGGFNFQSAWTTGWIAGRAMADFGSAKSV